MDRDSSHSNINYESDESESRNLHYITLQRIECGENQNKNRNFHPSLLHPQNSITLLYSQTSIHVSQTIFRSYGSNLPTSPNYFLSFDQRLFILKT